MSKYVILPAIAALAVTLSSPAQATWGGSSGKWGGSSGHQGGSSGSTGGSSGSTQVPEPGQLGLFAGGLVLLAARGFRRRKG